jgi:peptidoglycan/LPS O-acetylase OafA/YrhL
MTPRTDLTSIRLALASGVILSHCNPWCEAGAEPSAFGLGLGGWCVLGFFMLSGALVTASWRSDPDAVRFARKRALRILPGYATAFLVCALLIGPSLGASPTLADVGRLLTLQAPGARPFGGIPVDAPMYTIFWEVACYAAVPLLFAPFLRRPDIWIMVTTLFIILAISFPAASVYRMFAAFLVGAGFHAHIGRLRLPLPRIPDISFGTYLYGWPIQGVLVMAGVHEPIWLFITALPMALFAGWLSFRFVEQPAMARRPQVGLYA